MNRYEQKVAARKARMEARAAGLQQEANRTHQQARTMAEAIPFGQPILVGHHSEKRDRNYRSRIHNKFGKAFALQEQAQECAARAASVGTGGISSDDPDAVVKLREKLAKLQQTQNTMKAVNKAIRAHKTKPEQITAVIALGLSEKAAAQIIEPDFVGRIGFASYQLSNNNAEIRRVTARIAELERAAKRETVETEHEGFTYREDTEENRVMFVFDKKPAEPVRRLLRAFQWQWAPSRGAWVRKLSRSAIWDGEYVKEKLTDLLRGDTDAPN